MGAALAAAASDSAGSPREPRPLSAGPGGGAAEEAWSGRCLAVVGPTGSGKSELALRLAERLGGEIVSTDSLQVYRGLDIGTAKPDAADRARVPHHLLDVADPDQPFSAGDYVREALRVLADLRERGRLPILCGGTGLYFRALLQGISDIPAVPDAVRANVAARLKRQGAPALHAELSRSDPRAAARIHPNDGQRIARAMEVLAATGRPLSEFQAAQPYRAVPGIAGAPDVLSVGFAWERMDLYRRLDERVRGMLAAGLIDEARSLLARGYSAELKPLRAIGYLETVAYAQGRLPLEAVAPAIQTRTRHYAKRQVTWFKRHPAIFWAAPGDFGGVEEQVRRWLQR